MSPVAAYLDYNAGAPARPEVVAAVAGLLGRPGNPSSVHRFGREARRLMEEARVRVAQAVDAAPEAVVFTSGGTEANALALRGCGRRRILASAVEHPSVLAALPGIGRIPVDGTGRVDLAALDRMLAAEAEPALVSVMLANNETGVVQPVSDIVQIAHGRGALVHCDAAQALGRMSVSLRGLGVDMLSLSAHKPGGLPGAGALILADADAGLAPILLGGGQERRRRAGTENLPGIVGFGMAAELAAAEAGGSEPDRLRRMRDRLEAEAARRVPAALLVGRGAGRLVNTACLVLPGVASQTQVMALDLAGVAVSAGSACSSGKVSASHVLEAMGLPPGIAGCAVRVSLGWGSRDEEVDLFLAAWADLARRKGFEVVDAAEAA